MCFISKRLTLTRTKNTLTPSSPSMAVNRTDFELAISISIPAQILELSTTRRHPWVLMTETTKQPLINIRVTKTLITKQLKTCFAK